MIWYPLMWNLWRWATPHLEADQLIGGKSSLLSLLLRFYDLQDCHILNSKCHDAMDFRHRDILPKDAGQTGQTNRLADTLPGGWGLREVWWCQRLSEALLSTVTLQNLRGKTWEVSMAIVPRCCWKTWSGRPPPGRRPAVGSSLVATAAGTGATESATLSRKHCSWEPKTSEGSWPRGARSPGLSFVESIRHAPEGMEHFVWCPRVYFVSNI